MNELGPVAIPERDRGSQRLFGPESMFLADRHFDLFDQTSQHRTQFQISLSVRVIGGIEISLSVRVIGVIVRVFP